jgi:hypothetical protein
MNDRENQNSRGHGAFTLINVIKNSALILGLMLLHQFSTAGGALFFLILGIWAMTDTKSALKALTVSYIALIANKAYVPKNMAFAPGRILLLFIVFARVAYDYRRFGLSLLRQKYILSLVLFSFVCVVLAFVNQYFFMISALKIGLFSVGCILVLLSSELLKRDSTEMSCWYFSLFAVIALLGAASIPLGISSNMFVIGYAGSIFNGPFVHSQTLGPVAALILIYLLYFFFNSPYKLRWLSIPLSLCFLYFLYRTNSRTALIAFLGGAGVFVLSTFLGSTRGRFKIRLNVSKPMLVVMVFAGLMSIGTLELVTGGGVSSKVVGFIVKYGGSSLATEDLMSTRQGQIDMMMLSIREKPMTGISFGTSMDPRFAETATLLTAPTEKGFLPLAILEETGVIGTFFFLVFLITLLGSLIRARNTPAVGMFVGFLFANCGEMMFFSFGGQGGFNWLLFGGAVILGESCLEHRAFLRRV